MKIPSNWDVPARVRTRLGRRAGRQRVVAEEGHLLLVLHQPPDKDAREREGVLFWRAPSGEWRSSSGGSGLKQLWSHLETYAAHEARLDKAYHEAKSAADYFAILEAAAPLVRAAKNQHAALQEARDTVGPELVDLRDEAYETARGLELLYEDTKNALDFDIAQKTEEQARLGAQSLSTAHRLNTLAAIFFPLTAFASTFGMNLTHGLEARDPIWFWAMFALGLFAGSMVKRWALAAPKTPPSALPTTAPAVNRK